MNTNIKKGRNKKKYQKKYIERNKKKLKIKRKNSSCNLPRQAALRPVRRADKLRPRGQTRRAAQSTQLPRVRRDRRRAGACRAGQNRNRFRVFFLKKN